MKTRNERRRSASRWLAAAAVSLGACAPGGQGSTDATVDVVTDAPPSDVVEASPGDALDVTDSASTPDADAGPDAADAADAADTTDVAIAVDGPDGTAVADVLDVAEVAVEAGPDVTPDVPMRSTDPCALENVDPSAMGFAWGTGAVSNPYRVCTAEQFLRVAAVCNASTAAGGCALHFRIERDVDLTGMSVTPVRSFAGTFDGGGRTVRGLRVVIAPTETDDAVRSNVGLFRTIEAGGAVFNLTLVGAVAQGYNLVGALAGTNRGAITNVDAQGTSTIDQPTGIACVVGALVAWNEGTIAQTHTNFSVVRRCDPALNGQAGGVVGRNAVGGTLANCRAEGSIRSGGGSSAGIAALSHGTITNCHSAVEITLDAAGTAGGLVGNLGSDTGTMPAYITDSSASGRITAVGGAIGGLVGVSRGSPNIIAHSYASGAIVSSGAVQTWAGGLIGLMSAGNVDRGWSTGDVTVNLGTTTVSAFVGGLVGRVTWGRVVNAYARGAVAVSGTHVMGESFVGAVAGRVEGSPSEPSVLRYVYATGRVSAPAASMSVGGASGAVMGTSFFDPVFWDRESTMQSTSTGAPTVRGLTTSEMQTPATFAGWDATTIWMLAAGAYPTLR